MEVNSIRNLLLSCLSGLFPPVLLTVVNYMAYRGAAIIDLITSSRFQASLLVLTYLLWFMLSRLWKYTVLPLIEFFILKNTVSAKGKINTIFLNHTPEFFPLRQFYRLKLSCCRTYVDSPIKPYEDMKEEDRVCVRYLPRSKLLISMELINK